MIRAVLNRQQLQGHIPPSQKSSPEDEQDMRGTAGEANANS